MPGILIVDDTPLIRSTLTRILIDRGLAQDPIVEACNGEEAVRLAREVRPEIVFMDIRMPGLDGLQTTSIIRNEVPEANVVMLSAYDEFSYAQKALKLGVQDYLLKPVRPEKLVETLNEVRARAARAAAVSGAVASEKTVSVVEANLVENLIRGTMPDSETVADTLAYLQRELVLPAVIVLKPAGVGPEATAARAGDTHSLFKQIKATVMRHLPEPERAITGYSSPGRLIIILSADTVLQTVKARRALGERIRQQIYAESGITVTVGLGERYPLLNSVPLSYAEANLARRAFSASGDNVVVHIADLTTGQCPGSLILDPVQCECDLVQAIQERRPELAQRLLNRVLDGLAQRHREALTPWQNHCAEVIALVAWGVVNARVPAPRVLAVLHAQIKGLVGTNSAHEVRNWAQNSLTELLSLMEGVAQPENPVEAAVAYMRQAYSRPDLSLNEVAQAVNLSPSYLSSLFKEQTGETYIGTLTGLRLEQARHLLRTSNRSVADVARAVGYRHATNFYRCFGRETGMTPGEYREKE